MKKAIILPITLASSLVLVACGGSSSSGGGTPAEYQIGQYSAISNSTDYSGIWMMVQNGSTTMSSTEVSGGATENTMNASGAIHRRALMLIEEVPGTSPLQIDVSVCGETTERYTVDAMGNFNWDDGPQAVGIESTTGDITFSDFANFSGTMTLDVDEFDPDNSIGALPNDGESSTRTLTTTLAGVKLSNGNDISTFVTANTLTINSADSASAGTYAGASTDTVECFQEFEMSLNGSGSTVDEQNPGGPNINYSIRAEESEVEVITATGHEIDLEESSFQAIFGGQVVYEQTSTWLRTTINNFDSLEFEDSMETDSASVDEISTNTVTTSVSGASGTLTADNGLDSVSVSIDIQL